MLEQSIFATDARAVRELVHSRGWATLVSATATPVVSHLPILLEEPESASDTVTVLGHLARADADLHQLGRHDAVLVVEGPEGYVSPTWYEDGPYVPTWNFVVAHLHGRPEVLDERGTWDVLARTVERFESDRPTPWRLDSVSGYAHSIAPYTTGFRLTPTRVVGKAKLSQDKPAEIRDRVAAALDADPVHGNAALAEAMRHSARTLSETTTRPLQDVGTRQSTPPPSVPSLIESLEEGRKP